MAENMIKLGIKLDTANVDKELDNLIKKIQKDQKIKVDIDFGKSVESLKQLSSNLNKIQSEMSKFKIGGNGDLGAEKITQSIKKFESVITSMQNKLNTTKSNGFIDSSVITELQNKLNSINTDTPQKQIKELQNTIKNLSSSDSSIVRIQNAISKFSLAYDTMKNKMSSGSLIGNDQTESKLKKYESELNKLKSLQSQLENGKSFSGAKVTSEINGMTNASRQLNSTLQTNVKTATSFGSSIKQAFSNMGFYFTAYQGIQMVVNALKDGVQTITSIDTKMRDLRRVTDDATAETLNNFPAQANAMAISLGQTTENAIQATTVWKQLGYSWKDATEFLSKQSMVLSNVGDMTAEDSTNALVSTLKAFKLEAKDTTSVVDSLNEAGNKFAIKTGELAEGLRVGGASLAVANNSLEQSEALIITGTEVNITASLSK